MSNDSSTPTAGANTPASINGPAVTGNSPTVVLFQKAHAKMITLQRVDEQVQSLLDQRKKLHEELRGIQTQINEEFDRLLTAAEESLPKLNVDTKSPGKRNGKDSLRMEVAEAV